MALKYTLSRSGRSSRSTLMQQKCGGLRRAGFCRRAPLLCDGVAHALVHRLLVNGHVIRTSVDMVNILRGTKVDVVAVDRDKVVTPSQVTQIFVKTDLRSCLALSCRQ